MRYLFDSLLLCSNHHPCLAANSLLSIKIPSKIRNQVEPILYVQYEIRVSQSDEADESSQDYY